MNDDHRDNEPDERSWLEKIAQVFSSDPRTRKDLLDILAIAEQNEVIDSETHSIMQGALDKVCIGATDQAAFLCARHANDATQLWACGGMVSEAKKAATLAKDMLPQLFAGSAEGFDILQLLRPATFIPESKRLNVLLREFRENRNHIAIVIDEYGGVAGLVTIEDVLEEIVGEIEDEHDKQQDTFIKKLSENDFLIKALTPIEDFNEYFNATLDDEDFDTIGGIVMQKFGHLPRRNEAAEIDGFHFKVLNADSRQIHLLRLNLDPGASGG